MIIFFSLAVLFVVIALGALLPGLFKSREVAISGQDNRNVSIARERLAEVESDLARGIIDDEKYNVLRREIESTLVDDLDEQSMTEEVSPGGQWAAVAIAFMLPVLAAGIYLAIGTPSAVTLPPGIVSNSSGELPSQDDIPEMINSLAARLQQSPDDAEGWALLGRSYMTTGQYDQAVTAYDRLLSLAGDHPLILMMLADALTMSGQGQVSNRAADLIARALALDPENPQALWMSGIAAIQRGKTGQAISHWEKLEPMLGESPQQQAEVTALIQGAREMTGTSVAETGSRAAPGLSSDGDAVDITVSVDIGADLRDRVSPADTVFVYARAAQGPPMPLAVRRITVAELPADVTLRDSDAMTPAMTLSQFDSVIVGARVSSSGNAIAEPGDIQGVTGEISPATAETVHILMDDLVE